MYYNGFIYLFVYLFIYSFIYLFCMRTFYKGKQFNSRYNKCMNSLSIPEFYFLNFFIISIFFYFYFRKMIRHLIPQKYPLE